MEIVLATLLGLLLMVLVIVVPFFLAYFAFEHRINDFLGRPTPFLVVWAQGVITLVAVGGVVGLGYLIGSSVLNAL